MIMTAATVIRSDAGTRRRHPRVRPLQILKVIAVYGIRQEDTATKKDAGTMVQRQLVLRAH